MFAGNLKLPETAQEAEALLAQMAAATLGGASFRAVADQKKETPDEAAALMADAAGAVIWLSPGARRQIGEVVGQNLADLNLKPMADEPLELAGQQLRLIILSDGDHRSEALAQAQTRFQTLVEQIPAVTFAGNLDERASELYVGPQVEALLGYTQKEWLSNPILWYRQLHPEDHDVLNQEFMRGCLTDGRFKAQCRFFARDGRIVWVHGEARLIRDQYGNPISLQGVAFDITEIKRAEELIRQTLEEKEKLLQELEIAHAAALESARLKSQFLANTSHELRTPLNGVIGLTHVLKTTNLDSQQQEYIQTIRNCGELLLSTINDILDFEKSSAHKMTLETIDLDIHQLVEEAIGMMAEPAHRKRLELFSLVYPELPSRLRGDPGRLRQVLLNLVGNAVKFTERGRVVVRVKPIAEEHPPPATILLRIEVADTGIGLTPEQTKVLFQPFVQADGSMTRRFGGTGLGLAICKQLAELMGGEIGVESQAGQGCTFWFTIRLDIVDHRCFQPTQGIRGRRVLVVDDEETQLEVATAQLRGWKMRPEVARDGLEALKMLRQAARSGDPYALVLADLVMPGLSGTELSRRVAGEPDLTGTQVVLITGYRERVSPSDQVHLAAALSKPVGQSQLYNVIAETLLGQKPVATKVVPPQSRPLDADVLLVEDNEVNQQVAVQILKLLLGCRVCLAENGAVALEKLKEGRFDVVLMDCQMPIMDGYTATAHIRQWDHEHKRHTPIVAMTAHALAGDRERCLDAGMDDYVSKPLVPEDLRRALQGCLGRPTEAPAPEAPPEAEVAGVLDNKVISRLKILADGDREFLERLQAAFGQASRLGNQQMEAALATGDMPGLKQAAHTLTGAASNFGAHKVAQLCLQIEALADGLKRPEIESLVKRISLEAEQAERAFQVLLLS